MNYVKLKCIGGPNHHEYHKVPTNYRENDLVRIFCYPKLSVFDLPSPIPDRVEVQHNFYIISIIKFKEENQPVEEFKFLRHQKMSISEAFRIEFIY